MIVFVKEILHSYRIETAETIYKILMSLGTHSCEQNMNIFQKINTNVILRHYIIEISFELISIN